jgi:hypothetical protein
MYTQNKIFKIIYKVLYNRIKSRLRLSCHHHAHHFNQDGYYAKNAKNDTMIPCTTIAGSPTREVEDKDTEVLYE